ncbi:MAG: hypothetical protein GWP36_04920 [Bacteroidetes bacterium]|nr:hypothetical protein [Bacteroidota bacterium]
MKRLALVMVLCVSMGGVPMAASALTFKKGQVLGSDGEIYDGASPKERQAILARSKADGKAAGVFGSQLYVVVEDTVTFIPISDLAGKDDDEVEVIVVDRVTENVISEKTDKIPDRNSAEFAAMQAAYEDELAEDVPIATEEEVNAALDEIDAADIAKIAAAEALEATKEAWEDIDIEQLQEATQEAAEFAAQEVANIAASEAISNALDALQESGASEAEIQAFMDANPAPSE